MAPAHSDGGLNAASNRPSFVPQTDVDQYELGRVSKLFIAGGLAGIISRTATAPIDRLKMILQVQEGRQGMSLRQGFQTILGEGSFKAFFRGNGTNVVKIGPETALKLSLNDSIRNRIVADPNNVQLQERMLSGALAGASAQFTIYPMEIIRTRLAVCSSRTYRGFWDTAGKIYRHEGPLAFYRGLAPSLVGILPYAGVDITTFEVLKDLLLEHYEGQPPTSSVLMAGMVSSSVAQFVSYPLALVRTRLQVQGSGGREIQYSGTMDVINKTIEREGVRGLYKGLLPNMIKVAPAAGISWAVFDRTKLALGVDNSV